MKNEVSKEFYVHHSNPEEIQIRYLMKISGISRQEIEEMLQLYGVPPRSIINYIQVVNQGSFIKEWNPGFLCIITPTL